MDSLIDVVDDGGVRYLTLNRPGSLNALNSQVLSELTALVQGAERDRLHAVVIRGAGGRAFCAGADLDEIIDLDISGAHAFIRRGQEAMAAIENSPVPVIAAVDGYALGGGFEMMLACHLVLATDRSSFGPPEANIGCIPGFGGTQRLMAAAGRAAAFHLMVTGLRIDADRAWQIGLLSEPPVPADRLDERIGEIAGRLAGFSRTGIHNILEAGRRAVRPPALEHEAALAAIAIASADGKEGIRAFAAKRKPHFGQDAS